VVSLSAIRMCRRNISGEVWIDESSESGGNKSAGPMAANPGLQMDHARQRHVMSSLVRFSHVDGETHYTKAEYKWLRPSPRKTPRTMPSEVHRMKKKKRWSCVTKVCGKVAPYSRYRLLPTWISHLSAVSQNLPTRSPHRSRRASSSLSGERTI